MQRLCALIRMRIESAWDIQMFVPQTPISANRKSDQKRKGKEKSKKEEQPMLELGEWETDLKSTVQVDIMSDIKAALDEWLENPETAAAVASAHARANARAQRLTQLSHVTPVSAPLAENQQLPKQTDTNRVRSVDDLEGERTQQSIVEMMSSSFANLQDPDTTLSIHGSSTTPRTQKMRSPISAEIKDSWRQTPTSRKNMSPAMSLRMSKHASKRFSGSYFSPVETVISMLIFVRFFIPILTAPDTYGIDVKMSPANRRGLLLCAKVLAVLCNGVSFGAKEPYLMSMNGLIREYRPKLRSFLHAISAATLPNPEGGNASDEGEDVDLESDDDCSEDETVTIDELASQFKVVTVGAKIATKEEQRKSRVSFSRATYLGNSSFSPEVLDKGVPPVPPMPSTDFLPISASSRPRQQQQQQQQQRQLRKKSDALPSLPQGAQASTSAAAVPAASTRSTIDLSSTRAPNKARRPPSNSVSMVGAAAVATAASDTLVDSEIVDESLVTIDFLISLEANFAKFETYVYESTFGMPAKNREHLQVACRELKPIVHYAKNLSNPGKMPETVLISGTRHNSQDVHHRPTIPFTRKKSDESALSTNSEDFEDLGNQRFSVLPEDLRCE
ncbi:hypothetical protein FB639_003925 [Coemansia asiatica]|nr:hypothetical protein FB639_003925 [Coemansia asiatica]